jgi:hypothetical protein
MTLLTGRSPLSHGVRHAFPTDGDAVLGADSLPARLRQAGFTVEAVSDAGGDFLGRLDRGPRAARPFHRLRAPDLSVPGIGRRDALRRSVHLLPYLRGRLARRLLPPLRSVAELSDPLLLAEEGEGMLKQLRFRQRFFLLVHFSGYGRHARSRTDKAVGKLLQVLDDLRLNDSTWVVLWSPFAAGAEGDVSAPARFQSPLALVGPLSRPVSRRTDAPVRDIDVAPTILSAVGVPAPEGMEGLPLLELNADVADFGARDVYTETDLWTAPEQNPLPPARRLSYGPPSAWLEEDTEGPGRLRLRTDAEDASLSYRHRLLQSGRERLVYRPSMDGVLFEYYDLAHDPQGRANLAAARPGADRVKELKEVLFQELRRESGWRPQNDFWIPEALVRERKE